MKQTLKAITKALEPILHNEERQAKEWAAAFEKLDKQQQERIIATANALSEGMRQYQKAWGERYNLQNLQENLKRHREAKR